MTEEVSIEVSGTALDRWVSYSIVSDLLTPADAFRLEVSFGGPHVPSALEARKQIRELLTPGAEARVFVSDGGRNRSLQLTGIVEELKIESNRSDGTTISVQGRDRAAYLVDSSIDPGLIRNGSSDGSLTFLEAAEAACEPWSIQVTADPIAARDTWVRRRAVADETRLLYDRARALGIVPGSGATSTPAERAAFNAALTPEQRRWVTQARTRYANGLPPFEVEKIKVPEMRPFPGETAWDFLARHAKRLRLMLWFSPDGRLVIGSPDYGQAPSYRIVRRYRDNSDDPNSILEGGVTWQTAERYSSVTVYGRAPRGDLSRARLVATAIDPRWVGLPKPLNVYDSSIRNGTEAIDRANRELNRFAASGEVAEYLVPGHGQNGALYAIDTTIEVVDEVCGISGVFYIVSRTFEKSRASGTTTRLRLVPLGAISI